VIPPHDAAQDVECRMRPHQLVTALPIDLGVDACAHDRERSARFQRVPDLVVPLPGAGDAPRTTRIADQRTGVGRLSAATGIEDGAVQQHGPAVRIDLDDGRLGRARIRIGVAQVLAHAGEDT
jgi:hypothetical protein